MDGESLVQDEERFFPERIEEGFSRYVGEDLPPGSPCLRVDPRAIDYGESVPARG